MANYCSNRIVFFSDSEILLKDLLDKIQHCLRTPQQNSVENFVKLCGYNGSSADPRDYFNDCEDKISDSEYGKYFMFSTESAWSPNVEVFYEILLFKYKGRVQMVYQSEEEGFEIFISSDVDELFLKDKYKLYYCLNGCDDVEYFEDYSELIKYFTDNFPEAGIKYFDGIEGIKKKYTKAYGDDDNNHIELHYFEYDYDRQCA